MENRLAKILAHKIGQDDLMDLLAATPYNSLIPILVDTMHLKAQQIKAHDILSDIESKKKFYGPSSISQKELCHFQQLFFQIMPCKFESIQLPPIAPLGICSALTKLGQNERLTTIRKSEVVSDSTLFLAAEAALMRKNRCKDPELLYTDINLATFHRLLRLQAFDPSKNWSQHFEILGTITTGRRFGHNSFRNSSIREHIQMWIDFFSLLNKNGYKYQDIVFTFSYIPLVEWIISRYNVDREKLNKNSMKSAYDYFSIYNVSMPRQVYSITEIKNMLVNGGDSVTIYNSIYKFEEEVLKPLRSQNPNVQFFYELNRKQGLGYYNGICFHGSAKNTQGEEIDLIDGGSSDWVGQMLNDSHEITISSSFGVEMGITQFPRNSNDQN